MSTDKITILHTEWSRGWGGQEIRILAESRAFLRKGYDMLIACQPDGLLMQRAREAGVTTVPLVLRKGLHWSEVSETMRIIDRHGVDIVHTHSSVDAWKCGLAAKIRGVPVVRSRHLSTLIKTGWLSYFVYMKLADKVITSGSAIKDAMVQRNRMPAERIVSVPAGIDESRFTPEVDGGPVRRAQGFADDDFVIGIVAVLRLWKGHYDLIEAVKRLSLRGIPVKLLIVGGGPQEENFRAHIRAEGLEDHIRMVGHQDDVPAHIAAMDCVVLPSTRNEATSQVLPQAMAMKKPVIATSVGGLPEVVLNGETGLLVPPGDPAALAQAIDSLHGDPERARALAEQGYRHCLRHFTFTRMIEDTEAVYLDLLRRRTRKGEGEPASAGKAR